jgi:hypothetical protein
MGILYTLFALLVICFAIVIKKRNTETVEVEPHDMGALCDDTFFKRLKLKL